MSFLSKMLNKVQPRSKSKAEAELPGPGTFSLAVVGESHYQEALEAICGKRKREGEDKVVKATLILEDSNPHDKYAVRVEIEGRTVGHLGRDHAKQYRKKLAEAGHPHITASCMANIRGGWDRGNGSRGRYGVWLDLPVEEDDK